jgi:hypothetical protein
MKRVAHNKPTMNYVVTETTVPQSTFDSRLEAAETELRYARERAVASWEAARLATEQLERAYSKLQRLRAML